VKVAWIGIFDFWLLSSTRRLENAARRLIEIFDRLCFAFTRSISRRQRNILIFHIQIAVLKRLVDRLSHTQIVISFLLHFSLIQGLLVAWVGQQRLGLVND